MKHGRDDRLSDPAILAELRRSLPAEATQRTPSRALWMALHAAVVFASFHLASRYPGPVSVVVAIVVAGHALVCLGFLSHDLGHGSILARGNLREAVEVLAWGLNLVSRTLWHKVHNQTHHVHFGTLRDPDRQFVESERGPSAWAYSAFLLPNRGAVFPPLIVMQLIFYNARNLLAAFYVQGKKPAFVPAVPKYTLRDKASIVIDLMAGAALQVALCAVTGFDVRLHLAIAAGAYAVASGLSMWYILTNHALLPVRESPSILGGCTSVRVPRWCDALHCNFSFHTEHHLFPGLNSRFYPAVSRLLAERFPDQYQRVPIGAAWRDLWKNPMFARDPVHSIDS